MLASIQTDTVVLAKTLALLAIIMTCTTCMTPSGPARPYPQRLDYGNDSFLPSQYSRSEMDQDVRRYYDYWKAQYLLSAGHDAAGQVLYRIALGKPGQKYHAVTVSEGQGYGMIIVAIMAGYDPDALQLFNGLWRFTRRHASEHTPELMGWRVAGHDARRGDRNSAFDGDADIAYALILASQQWGHLGIIDYAAEARTLIQAIKRTMIGAQSQLPLLGDWVEPSNPRYNEYTSRTSDFMLAHFRAFYRLTGDRDWLNLVDHLTRVSQSLQDRYSPVTGLLPDFVQAVAWDKKNFSLRPADQHFLETEHDGSYYYNACRVPLRLGIDAVLNANPQARKLVQKMSAWLRSQYYHDIQNIQAGFKLDGTPLPGGNYFSAAFVAPFGVAAMTERNQQPWLNRIYTAVRNNHGGYYEDSINLLALLVMSGNFWDA